MFSVEDANKRIQGWFPGILGIEFFSLEQGAVAGRLRLRTEHMARNGYLHAATI